MAHVGPPSLCPQALFRIQTMAEKHTILFKKASGDAPVKDSVEAWNIACTDAEFKPMEETKEIAERDWQDEDGVDTYIPSKMPLKAYDMEVELCYKGDYESAYDAIASFMDYLTGEDGSGSEFTFYVPYTQIGRSGCYLKSFAPDDFWSGKGGDGLTFSITIRVTNPKSEATLESA